MSINKAVVLVSRLEEMIAIVVVRIIIRMYRAALRHSLSQLQHALSLFAAASSSSIAPGVGTTVLFTAIDAGDRTLRGCTDRKMPHSVEDSNSYSNHGK